MRKEPFTVGNYVHVYNRGNRKTLIVEDAKDRWRFLQMLYYFNTENSTGSPLQDAKKRLKSDFNTSLIWPHGWPLQKPIVKILAFVLMPNHYHLLLKEITEGGVTTFMRKLGTGWTNYFNTKYGEVGRLFQGAYKSKTILKEEYLKHLSVYIQVKNTFELYPGGLNRAIKEFSKAYEWSTNYPYCSLADYARNRSSPIIDKDLLGELFDTPQEYKNFAKGTIETLEEQLEGLVIESFKDDLLKSDFNRS